MKSHIKMQASFSTYRISTVAVGNILNCECKSNFSTLEYIFSSKLIILWDKKI